MTLAQLTKNKLSPLQPFCGDVHVSGCLFVCSYAVDLRIDNLLLFPDLEQNFELFEPMRSMQVGTMLHYCIFEVHLVWGYTGTVVVGLDERVS